MHDAAYRRVLTSKTIMERLFYETQVRTFFFLRCNFLRIRLATVHRARDAACKRQFSSVSHFSSFGEKSHLDRNTGNALVSLWLYTITVIQRSVPYPYN